MGRKAAIVLLLLLLGGATWFLVSRGALFTPSAAQGSRVPVEALGVLRPGEPVRILIVGTSITARGTWPQELEASLSECRPEGVVVERVARAGANSEWGEAALAKRLSAGPRPDVVVMEFAGNDARLVRGVSRWSVEARMPAMIAAVRSVGALPFLSTMSMTYGRERLERPWLPAYHGFYRAIAQQTGAGLIDAAPHWMALDADAARNMVPDGSHFTPAAARTLILPEYRAIMAPLICTM